MKLDRFKLDTVGRYDSLYMNFLKEAVVSENGITEGNFEIEDIKEAIKIYADKCKISAMGFYTNTNDTGASADSIRADVVYRCARLMYCVYLKSPAKRSKRVSRSHCISSYGLKHVLEYWLSKLSDNKVAKPRKGATSSYVSNGEAIMACLVFRMQFEDLPCPAISFNVKTRHDLSPNLHNIYFNSRFKHFLNKEIDYFKFNQFEFGHDVDGNEVAVPMFNEKRFMSEIKQPSNIWGSDGVRI